MPASDLLDFVHRKELVACNPDHEVCVRRHVLERGGALLYPSISLIEFETAMLVRRHHRQCACSGLSRHNGLNGEARKRDPGIIPDSRRMPVTEFTSFTTYSSNSHASRYIHSRRL